MWKNFKEIAPAIVGAVIICIIVLTFIYLAKSILIEEQEAIPPMVHKSDVIIINSNTIIKKSDIESIEIDVNKIIFNLYGTTVYVEVYLKVENAQKRFNNLKEML